MNQGWTYQNQITDKTAGCTVLDYYTERYRHSTRIEWQDRITTGQVLLNGQKVFVNTILQAGQFLTYHRPPWQEPIVPLEFELLYEDADILIVAKPSGLPVLPGGGFLEHTLLWQLQQLYPNERPVPIHRLGRGTSGLMLIARTKLARAHLSQQMRQHQIDKIYRALIGSSDLPDFFTITQPIGKMSHPLLGTVYGAVSPETAQSLFAQSDCVVLNRSEQTTLLEVKILTGRPHQIRIHLASIGFPLLGDPLYGKCGLPQKLPGHSQMAVPGDCGYSLHAYKLSFHHPTTGRRVTIACPAPATLAMI